MTQTARASSRVRRGSVRTRGLNESHTPAKPTSRRMHAKAKAKIIANRKFRVASDRLWDIDKILEYSPDNLMAKVRWAGVNPKTKKPWRDSWVDASSVEHARSWVVEGVLDERVDDQGHEEYLISWEGAWPDSWAKAEWLERATIEAWNEKKRNAALHCPTPSPSPTSEVAVSHANTPTISARARASIIKMTTSSGPPSSQVLSSQSKKKTVHWE
jgi:hypothetical protein